ncbi:MAG: hypothetical protein WC889_13015 [Myxococcota bacterium]|jgi:DNA-binding transcriptional regulator GbsR (MarR family)
MPAKAKRETKKATTLLPSLPESLVGVARQVGELIQHSGFDAILGEIWVAMVMHEGAVTAAQMADALGKKEAAIVTALREMERWGAIRRTQNAVGEEAWTPELNPLKFTGRVFKEREEPAVKRLEQLLKVAAADGSVTQFAKQRVKLLEEITHIVSIIFEIQTAIFQLDAPLIRRVRDMIGTVTGGVGGLLGSLSRFRGK